MKKTSGEEPPPHSTDLEGWRRAIAEERLRSFRPEILAAAFQDLGPKTDRRVRDALTKQLSGIIIGMLRKRVDTNRPDQGKDVIFRVHAQIFGALLTPSSADGKALRTSFGSTVLFRMKTALADESRAQIVPAPKSMSRATGDSRRARGHDNEDTAEPLPEGSEYEIAAGKEQQATTNRDPLVLDAVQAVDDQIDSDRIVKRVLRTIPTYKKRLAYYLYLHNVPAKSKIGPSIAKACGVSERTVRAWVEEIENDLKQNEEVLTLLKTISGARP